LQILVKWWSEYPAHLLQSRVVDPLQQYLTDELSTTKKLTVSVMNSIKVLAKVEEANQLGRQLPPEAFYNLLIRSVTASMHCLPGCHSQKVGLVLMRSYPSSREKFDILGWVVNIYTVTAVSVIMCKWRSGVHV
jgi:hypothetical protein